MEEQITVSVASIPYRINELHLAIDSIYTQVHNICVYLNGYEHIPSFLLDNKIEVFLSQQYGDRGDIGKFFPIINKKGYVLTIDDDIIYPANYANIMCEKIEQYERRSFICVHGNILPQKKLTSYYEDKIAIHFRRKLTKDRIVDVPGTGTLAYHSSIYSFQIEDFKAANMCDIWLHEISIKNNISIVCIEREDNWLISSLTSDPNSIYSQRHKTDKLQTEVLNKSRGYI